MQLDKSGERPFGLLVFKSRAQRVGRTTFSCRMEEQESLSILHTSETQGLPPHAFCLRYPSS